MKHENVATLLFRVQVVCIAAVAMFQQAHFPSAACAAYKYLLTGKTIQAKELCVETELEHVERPHRSEIARPINPIIVEAVNNKRVLSFTYNGRRRTVEPECYGIGSGGMELLRGCQLTGGRQSDALFNVSRIEELVPLEHHFSEPPGYQKGDSAMRLILAEL